MWFVSLRTALLSTKPKSSGFLNLNEIVSIHNIQFIGCSHSKSWGSYRIDWLQYKLCVDDDCDDLSGQTFSLFLRC